MPDIESHQPNTTPHPTPRHTNVSANRQLGSVGGRSARVSHPTASSRTRHLSFYFTSNQCQCQSPVGFCRKRRLHLDNNSILLCNPVPTPNTDYSPSICQTNVSANRQLGSVGGGDYTQLIQNGDSMLPTESARVSHPSLSSHPIPRHTNVSAISHLGSVGRAGGSLSASALSLTSTESFRQPKGRQPRCNQLDKHLDSFLRHHTVTFRCILIRHPTCVH